VAACGWLDSDCQQRRGQGMLMTSLGWAMQPFLLYLDSVLMQIDSWSALGVKRHTLLTAGLRWLTILLVEFRSFAMGV